MCIFSKGQDLSSSQSLMLHLYFFMPPPPKKFLSSLYKAFLWPVFTYASARWCSFFNITFFTEQLIMQLLTASHPPLSQFSRGKHTFPEVTLTHFALPSMIEPVVVQPSSIQIWQGLERNQHFSRFSWRAFASTYPTHAFSFSRKTLLAFSFAAPWTTPSVSAELTFSTYSMLLL